MLRARPAIHFFAWPCFSVLSSHPISSPNSGSPSHGAQQWAQQVHRDIKTENILLNPGDTPVVADFGFLGKARQNARQNSRLAGPMKKTMVKPWLGSAWWMVALLQPRNLWICGMCLNPYGFHMIHLPVSVAILCFLSIYLSNRSNPIPIYLQSIVIQSYPMYSKRSVYRTDSNAI